MPIAKLHQRIKRKIDVLCIFIFFYIFKNDLPFDASSGQKFECVLMLTMSILAKDKKRNISDPHEKYLYPTQKDATLNNTNFSIAKI